MAARRQRRFSGRSKAEWALRGTLAIIAAAAGLASTTSSLATVAAKVDPLRAHLLAPSAGPITAAAAQQQFVTTPRSGSDSAPAHLARQALRQDPTATDALTVLGFQAQLRGDAEQARRVFAYSLALSRRELRPRLWAIEEAVLRGDVAEALRNHDIALRTSGEAPDLLFPILASAIAEPKIRGPLIDLLSEEPAWARSFIYYTATSGSNPQATARFFLEARRADLPIRDTDRASVVNSLADRGLLDEAWRFYASFRTGADRRRSRDPNFTLQTEVSSSFDWLTTKEPALFVAILPNKDGGLLDFAVPAGNGGVIAQQMQLLPPGQYRLAGRAKGIEQPDRSRPYWRLGCLDGRELGRVEVPNSANTNGTFSELLTVPEGCAGQILALVTRPSDKVSGTIGQIEEVQLAPAG